MSTTIEDLVREDLRANINRYAKKIPVTPNELHAHIEDYYHFNIPQVAVCDGHVSPFDAISDAFFARGGEQIWVGPRTGGKGSPVSTPVATPTGWRKIGDLVVGDEVIGDDGRPTRVLAVYDRGVLPVYRVGFSDGSSLVVDADHLWAVQTRKRRKTRSPYIVLSTSAIIERGFNDRDQALLIPMVEPVQYPEADLPIDPYAMGMLLANGYLDVSTFIALNGDDEDIAERLLQSSKLEAKRRLHGAGIRLGISGVAIQLRILGLFGTRSATKFIPKSYLTASWEQRADLLHGLMDGDGTSDNMTARYSTTSEQLALDVRELVESLGGTGRVSSRGRDGYVEHRITVNLPRLVSPFWGKRKRVAYGKRFERKTYSQPTRRIASIELAGKENVRCIGIDNASHLYVSDRYIVSHNTLGAAILEHLLMSLYGDTVAHGGAIEAQAFKCYEYLRRFFGSPAFAEDVLGESLMSSTLLRNGGKVEVLPLTMNRVNSPHTRFLFLDEIELTTTQLINEARSIPMRVNGRAPLTIYTSSRKKAHGPMEAMLRATREAKKQDSIKTWCVFEIIEECPPERHHFGAPSGCGSCKLEPVCREKEQGADEDSLKYVPGPGRSARARGWMPIDDVILKYEKIEEGVFNAQWLSLRPETKGLAYPHFSEDVHVIDYTYQPALPVVCGIDFGYTNPSVAVYAQPTASDDIVIFAEDYGSGRTADQFGASIKKAPWFPNTSWRVADSAAAGDRATLNRLGISNEPSDKSGTAEHKSSIISGINLVRWALKPKGRRTPILYVARNCPNTIREFMSYHHPEEKDDKNVDERPMQSDDHAMDAVRYMMRRLFRGRVTAGE